MNEKINELTRMIPPDKEPEKKEILLNTPTYDPMVSPCYSPLSDHPEPYSPGPCPTGLLPYKPFYNPELSPVSSQASSKYCPSTPEIIEIDIPDEEENNETDNENNETDKDIQNDKATEEQPASNASNIGQFENMTLEQEIIDRQQFFFCLFWGCSMLQKINFFSIIFFPSFLLFCLFRSASFHSENITVVIRKILHLVTFIFNFISIQ